MFAAISHLAQRRDLLYAHQFPHTIPVHHVIGQIPQIAVFLEICTLEIDACNTMHIKMPHSGPAHQVPQHAAVFPLGCTNTITPRIAAQCQPLVIPEQAHGFFIRRIFCKAHLMFHRKGPKRITAPARRLLFPCSFFAAPASTKIQVQRHIFKASVVCKVLIFDPVPDRMVKQMLYILHRDRAYRAKSGQSPIIRHCRLQHVTAALARCPKQYGTRRAAFQRGLQPDRGGNVRQEAPAGGLLPRYSFTICPTCSCGWMYIRLS